MRSIHLLGLSLLVTLAACSDGQEDAVDTTTPAVTATPAAPASPVKSEPVQIQAAGTGTVTDPNPPHGEPGHRCEIPVGASLSGTPPSSGPMDQLPPMGAQPADGGGGTPPGINPPHGQPGHDCAVPVGSPPPAK